MNIALFHSTLPEADRKLGGVEVMVHRLAEQLVRRGHEVTLYSFSERPRGAAYRHVALRPATLRDSALARTLVVPALLNLVEPDEAEVLHLHGDDWFYLRRPLPTVRTFHGSALLEARHATRWRRRIRQLATYPLEVASSRLATVSYSVGTEMGPLYRSHGVLPNGVDVPDDLPDQESERPSILFVGTWGGRKRGRFLRDLFIESVLPRVSEAELWMVSDRCEGSPGVRWFRFPSDEELRDLYRRAWLFCLPSTYEGFGIPYLEAMANGTPAVASPNAGARLVLGDGQYGPIAPDGQLAAILVRLLRDPDARQEWRERGRARARKFAWPRVVDAHEAAYRHAIARWSDQS